jgi:hypothetical protein
LPSEETRENYRHYHPAAHSNLVYPRPFFKKTEILNQHRNRRKTGEDCTTFWNMMYQGLDVYLSVALTTLGVQELVH